MRKLLRYTYILLVALVSVHQGLSQELANELKDLSYLIGRYKIKTYMPDGKGGWSALGKGESEISTILGGRFLVDQKATRFGNNSLTTFSTIGEDPRTKEFRFIALDKEFGTMDVYKGVKLGKSLIVDNLGSDARFIGQDGNSLAFRLEYHYIAEDRIDFLVFSSKDEGQSWQAYAKAAYSRVN